MKNIRILFISSLLIITSASAKNWRVNWQHSKVSFKIPYMELTHVDGAFTKFDGAFDFEESSKKLENIEFIISTKSIDTNNSKRDNHIKNKDFFNVAKYPQIKFKSTKTVYDSGRPVKLIGNLELMNVNKTVTFDIDYKGSAKDPWDDAKTTQFFEASTTINRKDYGLSWNKALDKGGFLLGDKVSINITIEAFEEGVRPAFSRFYLPTHNIKKAVATKVKNATTMSSPVDDTAQDVEDLALSNIPPQVVDRPTLPSNKDMALNVVFGFLAFVLLIGGGIKLQITITKFLDKRNVDPRWTFLIPNIITMALIMYIATFLAPFMGYGPHPWGN